MNAFDRMNDRVYSTFGVSVTYYANRAMGGDPVTITAIRVRRSPDEFNQAGAFEGLEVREADFTAAAPAGLGQSLPTAGDIFTIDGTDYVLSEPPRNPDPDSGTVTLILSRRQGLNA
jgi:hypothetical protein